MARNVTYEVYVQQGGRWEIHARHGAAEKEASINEAKSLVKMPKIDAVRVVKETYDTADGSAEESTIYKDAKDPAARRSANSPRPPPPQRSPPPPRPAKVGRAPDPPNRGGRAQTERRPGASNKAPPKPPATAKPTKKMGIVTKLLLVTLSSIAIASVVTGLAALALRQFSGLGMAMSGDLQANVMFAVFVGTFMLIALPLAWSFLKHEAGLLESEPTKRPAPTPVKKAEPAKKKDASREEPVTRDEDAEEPVAEEPEADEVEEPAEEEQEDEQEDADEPLSPEGEKQRVSMMAFLGQSLERVNAGQQKMDAFNKFGINLFLAGACEGLARSHDLDNASTARILSESVQIIGFGKAQADSFSNKCDEYLLADSRYMQMYHEGRNAMSAHVSGDTEGAGKLEKALVEWNTPKQREESTGPISVMFTDMVGSTKLTQTRGDAVAQQVVRAHNRIVRDALSKYAGKEIKHTGDGIMASFPTTSNAVEGAIFIQRETKAQNAANPDLPLVLKVGINAGEPIAEDDDLFGTTVQLAARIVDKAQQGEILVSGIVRGICAGKELKFSNRGGFEMKGFADPVTLYEVTWEDGATATAAAAPAAQDAGGVQEPAPETAPAPAAQTSEAAAPEARAQPVAQTASD
ncbi:MAG: adenylate/guanylate cyclase domain-containing protein [Rhodospirillales bacterium]|nr:adenylate/guanylate cyclase domain-containing protein [Rhodospirillales bacterium]